MKHINQFDHCIWKSSDKNNSNVKLTQVPPSLPCSITPTLAPSWLALRALPSPPDPPPITRQSNVRTADEAIARVTVTVNRMHYFEPRPSETAAGMSCFQGARRFSNTSTSLAKGPGAEQGRSWNYVWGAAQGIKHLSLHKVKSFFMVFTTADNTKIDFKFSCRMQPCPSKVETTN